MTNTINIPKNEHDEIIAVLNAARIMLKNRDQRPEEIKLLDAIKYLAAREEAR